MKARATVRLKLTPDKKLTTVFRALEPETHLTLGVRSRASLKKERNLLILNIEAEDSVALRAALNAYLRWMNSVLNVFQALEAKTRKSPSF